MDTIISKIVTFIDKLKRKKRSNNDPFDYQSIKEDDVQLTEDEEKSRNILNKIDMSLCPVEYYLNCYSLLKYNVKMMKMCNILKDKYIK